LNSVDAQAFWKNSHEVDALMGDVPIEVKYQEHISDSDFKGLREFMKKFRQNSGIMVTKKDERTVKNPEGNVRLVPAWKFLLEGRKSAEG
ncbi:MAG: hypothetical protein V1909_03450, partial [Candidatus Micrarchaeota archaeon]